MADNGFHILFLTAHVVSRHHTMMRAIGMAPALANRGHRVTIVADDHPDNRALIEPLAGVAHAFVSKGHYRKTMRERVLAIGQASPHVIHSCGLDRWTWVSPKARRGAFWIVDHVERLSALSGMSSLQRMYYRHAESRALQEADGTVAASRYLEFCFRQQMFRTKCQRPLLWLPYAVSDAAVKRMAEGSTAQWRVGSTKTMLYAGGFYEAYGVYEIVEALRLLMGVRRDWTFGFHGRGPERERLQRDIRASGLANNVSIHDYLPENEYERALSRAAVLISPMHDTEADWARCPSKLYYYIAAGCAIVTSRIGENQEALGDHAYYYTPGNPVDMARAMSAALDAAGSGDRPKVAPSGHTWETRADKYLSWLRSALSSTSKLPCCDN